MTAYRKLCTNEINELIIRGNSSDNWDMVMVSDGFKAESLTGCTLRGEVKLGVLEAEIYSPGGVKRKCGIYNAEIINCTIGDGVFISNIGSYIANYNIGNNVYIESLTLMEATGKSSFGNGVEVAAVNEGGGREVPIYNELTAQIAYIIAMYRHRSQCINIMCNMIRSLSNERILARGTIGNGAIITGCNSITDVNIGPGAVLRAVSTLTNGSINSTAESPVIIGAGVKAHDFIISQGAIVDNGAIIKKSFIGEACRIDLGYTAIDSLFFANCDCANGEACSIFAGPYSVSHHKSSLLIAGIFSFFNAGSAVNQSNHMFKTGAVHQGVHERGCKFGSNAYVMLPSREGAFTVLLGRHTNHHDTSNFPYSFLIEEQGKSYLVPASNLTSYGTMRDIAKWQDRDRRGSERRDIINFEQYNPYLGSKVAKAIELSRHMLSREGVDTYNYERVKIKSIMLRRGMRLYQHALDSTIGYILANADTSEAGGDTEWADIAGMYAPMKRINALLDDIECNKLVSLTQINTRINEIHTSYQTDAYQWALLMLTSILEHHPSPQEVQKAIERADKSNELLRSMASNDAKHDVDTQMRVGYGIDHPSRVADDFLTVRKL